LKTFHIHISGCVQGVGFRPFVFNLAQRFGLKGGVSNDEKGVVIVAQGSRIVEFLSRLEVEKPKSSQIFSIKTFEHETSEIFETFSIKPTPENITVDIPLTPDFATCPDCEKELFDPKNRRYFYPFTTCTQCGPRYAIAEKFPFERENTSISEFKMCPNCLHEYQTSEDIRFHSQTNTCPDCGIKLKFTDNSGRILEKDNKLIFNTLSEKLNDGKIIAVKNTSGYLLLCDATNSEAVAELRKRKNRPTKPFAVLFPSLEMMRNYLFVEDFHEKEFLSPEAPICIIKVKNSGDLARHEIAPNMDTIGAMYPYTGMLKLIAKTFGKPLIATSGNFHGSPICSSETESVNLLKNIADFYIHHNLKIVHAQDDSIIAFSPKFHRKIILRRARGYAPNFFFADELQKKNAEKKKILALGADLKNTFTTVPNNHCYISEYIGDLAKYDTFLRHEKTIKSYQKKFNFTPDIILADKHPLYTPTPSEGANSKIQHHLAHFSAVLGEHRLWESVEPVLGVVWDGVGFFSEKEIWGGEFFVYENKTLQHVAQLEPFVWILGDKMSKKPKISALSISRNHEFFRKFFNANEWEIYTKLIDRQEVKTSSMGRLFDAVGVVLGCSETISFEGEAAMFVEKLANSVCENNDFRFVDYLKNEKFDKEIPTEKLFKIILKEADNQGVGVIALNFHYTLIKCIEKISHSLKIKNIAFSGGVWQNSVLVDLAVRFLQPNFKLFFHENLSPNDENISFGQLNYFLNFPDKK
ncbi:MAG: carbamoyltransferase HypF, partial [Flavobacteriaceae bacterium]|nr:carbamoyltransferase HypF [Flavobacteriaceae bacterium]